MKQAGYRNWKRALWSWNHLDTRKHWQSRRWETQERTDKDKRGHKRLYTHRNKEGMRCRWSNTGQGNKLKNTWNRLGGDGLEKMKTQKGGKGWRGRCRPVWTARKQAGKWHNRRKLKATRDTCGQNYKIKQENMNAEPESCQLGQLRECRIQVPVFTSQYDNCCLRPVAHH